MLRLYLINISLWWEKLWNNTKGLHFPPLLNLINKIILLPNFSQYEIIGNFRNKQLKMRWLNVYNMIRKSIIGIFAMQSFSQQANLFNKYIF